MGIKRNMLKSRKENKSKKFKNSIRNRDIGINNRNKNQFDKHIG